MTMLRLASVVVALTTTAAAFAPGAAFRAASSTNGRSPLRVTTAGERTVLFTSSWPVESGAELSPAAASPVTGRRDVLLRSASLALATVVAQRPNALAADDSESESGDSLTSRMFNPDGSLRSGSVEEVAAKSRTVEALFPVADGEAVVSLDGAKPSTASDNGAKVSYSVPQKWSQDSGANLYLDPSEGVNSRAARRIAAYSLPAPADEKILDKATTIGVAKALGIPTVASQIGYAKSILGADLVSGRKSVRDGIKYYEFDLAVAPDTCEDDKDVGTTKSTNLGLGFCPYDSVVILGAAVVEGRMYVISVESDRDMWKRANADLKRVRSSFRVEV